MTIYDGGGQDADWWSSTADYEDNRLGKLTGNNTSLQKSSGNQIFISFVNNGNGIGKGFSGSIKFSKHHFCSKSVLTQVFFTAELRGQKALPSRQG